jgi:hypothetical protein
MRLEKAYRHTYLHTHTHTHTRTHRFSAYCVDTFHQQINEKRLSRRLEKAYIHTYVHTYTHTYIHTHNYTQVSCILGRYLSSSATKRRRAQHASGESIQTYLPTHTHTYTHPHTHRFSAYYVDTFHHPQINEGGHSMRLEKAEISSVRV